MKKLINKHKNLVGAMLVAPFCWRLFQNDLCSHPSFLFDIMAMFCLGVASFWFGYSLTRDYAVTSQSVVGKSRIKLEIKLFLWQCTTLFAMIYNFAPIFLGPISLWDKIFLSVGLIVGCYPAVFVWLRWNAIWRCLSRSARP